jgi:hypothetical protein
MPGGFQTLYAFDRGSQLVVRRFQLTKVQRNFIEVMTKSNKVCPSGLIGIPFMAVRREKLAR